jgi:hypothetical protein
MIGDLLISGLKSVFIDLPVMVGGLLISGLKTVFIDLPVMVGGLLISGLKTVFVDLPVMVGGLLISGLKSVFIDLPVMIGSSIVGGLQSIFIDLPTWLGSTILGGITSLMGMIPGAIYQALYSAASTVGLGWVVEGLAGGGAAKAVSTAYEGAKSTVSGTVDKVKSTASSVASGVASVGSSLWSGAESLLGLGESPIDSIVPLMSEFYNAGLGGKGILTRILGPTTESIQSLSPVQNVESSISNQSMAPTSFKSQFTDDWSNLYHPLKQEPAQLATNKISDNLKNTDDYKTVGDKILTQKQQPESLTDSSTLLATFMDQALNGSAVAVKGIKESEIEKITKIAGLEGVVPNTALNTSNIIPTTNAPVSINPVSPMTGTYSNIETKIMKDKATLSPDKSEIISPELENLTSEAEEQTEVLMEMRDLFEKFLDLMKPKSVIGSEGGEEPGSTKSRRVVGKPTNYYRRAIGNVSQSPGKASVNLGAKSLS